jgi:hypothetical protein
MFGNHITAPFYKMGARARVVAGDQLKLNILRDDLGEFFDITAAPQMRLQVVDLQKDQRHLLLMGVADGQKHKYLCGHDERHWFVAGVPNDRGVSNVRTAMEALKPPVVRFEQERKRVKGRQRESRRNAAYVRQGEWFFIPWPDLRVAPWMVHSNEPLQRSGGKPHMAEFAVRNGGEQVYVSTRYPRGLNQAEYNALIARRPALKADSWRMMRRNATVFVRGRISHPDHATITLGGWHLVVMNTEHRSVAMRHVAFLD